MNKYKILCFILLGMLCYPAALQSQTSSPLTQVMLSTPLNDRPEVFRELQDDIRTKYSSTKPGLDLSDFYGDIQILREKLLAMIDTVEINKSDGNIVVTYKGEIILKNNLNILLMNDSIIFVTIQPKVSNLLQKKIDGIFSSNPTLIKTKGAIISAVLRTLQVEFPENNISTTDSSVTLAKALSAIIFAFLEKGNTKIQEEEQRAIYNLQSKINASINSLKGHLTDVLNKGEQKVANIIDQASRWLASGNIGVAASKGSGEFAGGFGLSVNTTHWQFGGYVNGQFGKSNPSSTIKTLAGVQGKTAWDGCGGTWELDLLVSTLFGGNNRVFGELWECGTGISDRVSQSLLMGIAYYNMPAPEPLSGERTHLSGITFKGTTNGSPGLFLGGNFQEHDRPHYIFQVILPVLPTK